MIIKGTAMWAKILTPVDTYAKDGKEYTLDLVLDEEAVKALTDAGLSSKVKEGKYEEGPHIKFQLPTHTRKGDPLDPPEVKDKYGEPWDPDTLIGNGSQVAVMFNIREGEFNNKPWRKPGLRKVQVLDLVEVEGRETFDYEVKPEESTEEVWSD